MSNISTIELVKSAMESINFTDVDAWANSIFGLSMLGGTSGVNLAANFEKKQASRRS